MIFAGLRKEGERKEGERKEGERKDLIAYLRESTA